MTTDPAKGHDSWIRVGNWEDSTNTRTGYRHSQLGQPGDFHGSVQEQHASGAPWNSKANEYDWHISRQRTEREGRDERGQRWSGQLAGGTEPTLAKAKSAANRAMRAHRMEHILAGGDVGYGDAPTGDQIRGSIAARRALEPGQSMVMASGEHDGVIWQRRLSRSAGTIGVTESFRLAYGDEQLDTLLKGRTAEEAAAEFREQVDSRPARQAAVEPAQRETYDVDAIVAKVARLNPRYRGSAAIHNVTGIDSGAMGKYGPMVSLFNDLKRGLMDPSDAGRWHAENFSREAVAGQADRAEAIAQVLDRTEHEDPEAMARAAAGLHEYARAAREALNGTAPQSAQASAGRDSEASRPAGQDSSWQDWQEELARLRETTRQAGEANAAALAHRMALTRAQQIHLRETTGLVLPHPGDMRAGAAQTEYMIATGHLLAGRFAEGQEALDRAKETAAASRDRGAVARLEKLSAQVARTQPKAAPPALVRTGRANANTVTAIDQAGTEHTITWRDGEVTVTSPAGTLSGPAGDDPAATARELAGQLAEQSCAGTPDLEPEA